MPKYSGIKGHSSSLHDDNNIKATFRVGEDFEILAPKMENIEDNDKARVQEEEPREPPKRSLCRICKAEIVDELLSKIGEDTFHQRCLCCSECKDELAGKCYERDSHFLCEKDYRRLYGPRCFLCSQPIFPKTPIRHIENQACHMSCVRCKACNRELHTGEKCRLNKDKKLECLRDHRLTTSAYEGMFHRAEYSPFTRKTRTIIYPHQYDELNRAYSENAKPSKRTRDDLAVRTGLDKKVVQVWFQNQRAKWKRNELKTDRRVHLSAPTQLPYFSQPCSNDIY